MIAGSSRAETQRLVLVGVGLLSPSPEPCQAVTDGIEPQRPGGTERLRRETTMGRPEVTRSGHTTVGDNTPPETIHDHSFGRDESIGPVPAENQPGHRLDAEPRDKPLAKFVKRFSRRRSRLRSR